VLYQLSYAGLKQLYSRAGKIESAAL
jgi:hypothetical protein